MVPPPEGNINTAKGGSGGTAPPQAKIVGPNITGKKEEYRLERRLQSGLFGGVYEAKGLSSGRLFAVKVLHRSELHKAQRASSLEFCEVPLSEIKYSDLMLGHQHVMQVEDHFEDQYCHYIVFELAAGGDLLEALKLKPNGFEESQAQFLIGQAAKGLAILHERRLAMQDVSLENMLLHVLDDGEYQVKICDPGQAVLFEFDPETGEEIPVRFHGYVGKSFRPPEIHQKQPYLSTKVDAWCLGWSTFYLLAAQPLFLSADPTQQDLDWELFERGELSTLFRQKATSCSQQCIDFILRCLQIDPKKRMSVSEALQHDWLRDSDAKPMHAPKELLPQPPSPDIRDGRSSDLEYVRPPMNSTPTHEEAGLVSPTIGGNLNGHANDILLDPGSNSGPNAVFRGGLAGSVSSGLSAGGHFSSGGGPGGLGTSADWQGRRSGQQLGLAPAWKMAPPSRSESPGPGSATALLGRPGFYQGGSTGTPLPNQYAPTAQARAASPLQRGAGYVNLQRRSPSPPPRPGAQHMRAGAGTNVYGTRDSGAMWADVINQSAQMPAGGAQNSHTPRPARASGIATVGVTRSLMAPGPQGVATADGVEYGVSPQLSAALPGPQQQLSASVPLEGIMADGDVDPRFSTGDIVGGSGRQGAGGRTSSPMPQASVILRPQQNARGVSPSPMRNLGGIDPSKRSGSPMQPHGPGATRGISGQQVGSIDAGAGGLGGSQFWPTPRAGSPGNGLLRGQASEVFSRGRSHQRTLSPTQPGLSAYGGANQPPGGLMRTMSPSGGALPGRSGIAWCPVPPSPPAPTRSISPQPSGIVVGQGHNNSVSSLRWEPMAQRLR